MAGDKARGYQELFDPEPNREYYYSNASAIVFSALRILRKALELLLEALLFLLPARHLRRYRLRLLFYLVVLAKPLIEAVEQRVDHDFYLQLKRTQSERNETGVGSDRAGATSVTRLTQPGDRIAALVDGPMNRALGWNPGRQREIASGEFRPRCLLLRPFGLDNRFFWDLAPFTSADPEPISKWPLLEVSLFRLVHGLGGDFVTAGDTAEPFGSPRHQIDADWQPKILAELEAADLIFVIPFYTQGTVWEIEAIAAAGHLAKTLFVMPPSAWRPGRDMDTNTLGGMLWLFGTHALMRLAASRSEAGGSIPLLRRTEGGWRTDPVEDPHLQGDWEEARRRFAECGIALPLHTPSGALFSYENLDRPVPQAVLAMLTTSFSARQSDEAQRAAREELTDRLRVFTAVTGGNPRSLVSAVGISRALYPHTAEVIEVVLDRLECRLEQARGCVG